MLIDESLRILSNEDIRNIAYFLAEENPDILSEEELTEEMLEQDLIESEDYENFMMSLHHHYLPKLDEGDIIDYDPRSNTFVYDGGESFEELVGYLKEFDKV